MNTEQNNTPAPKLDPTSQHLALVQMIDNCARAVDRNDSDALRSFSPKIIEMNRLKIDLHETMLGDLPVDRKLTACLSNAAAMLLYIEKRVLPHIDPAEMLRIQIELIGSGSPTLESLKCPLGNANCPLPSTNHN